MTRLRSIFGYVWASTALFLILAAFMGNSNLSSNLAAATGITISPWFSGGEIVKTLDHGAYRTHIHRPIFDAIIGQRENGFIQVNWEPMTGLPPIIREAIDYRGDGRENFLVTLDTETGQASVTSSHPGVRSVEGSYRLKNGWAVRILLRNEPKRPQ